MTHQICSNCSGELVEYQCALLCERCQILHERRSIFCEDCGEAYAEYLSESGVCRCERCADAAIAYGRQHMPEAYDDAQ